MKILSLFVICLCIFSNAYADEDCSVIEYHITLKCPPSIEREAFKDTVPASDYQSPNHEAWVHTTVNELEHLIALVKSGHYEDAQVTCGSSDSNDIDFSNLAQASVSLDFLCRDCSELEFLKTQKAHAKDCYTYADWSKSTIQSLHALQMLIIKEKIDLSAHGIENGSDQEDGALIPVKCFLEIKGPMSDEFQAFLDAIPDNDNQFTNYHEWSVIMIDMIHKLEKLLLSGKINYGKTDINF